MDFTARLILKGVNGLYAVLGLLRAFLGTFEMILQGLSPCPLKNTNRLHLQQVLVGSFFDYLPLFSRLQSRQSITQLSSKFPFQDLQPLAKCLLQRLGKQLVNALRANSCSLRKLFDCQILLLHNIKISIIIFLYYIPTSQHRKKEQILM